MSEVIAVNVVHTLSPSGYPEHPLSAIDKRPVPGRVAVHTLGVDGDRQLDTTNHGGVEQAVYAYASEDAAWWARELDREVPPGAFGENLTTSGLDVTGALLGERWRIGGALLQVSSIRLPCRTFARFWDVPDLIKRFTAHGVSGAYLAVLEEGDIGAGDPVEVVHRPAHELTVGRLFRALTTEPELLPLVRDCADAPEDARATARQRIPTGSG
jgi:MOSC domain-containing protein YiiM